MRADWVHAHVHVCAHTYTHIHALTHFHKAALARVRFSKVLRTLGIFLTEINICKPPRALHTIRGFCSRTTHVCKGTNINISK